MDKYFLHINEPCTQEWESMTTAEHGKFCNNCNKTVFDFTTATDAAIVKHTEAMKGEMFCGRFEENQLDRWIERSDIKTINPRLYKFLISFMLLGAAKGANAQTTPAQEKVATQRKLDSLVNLDYRKAASNALVCDTIKGNQKITNGEVRIGRVTSFSMKPSTEPLIFIDGISINQQRLQKIDPDKIISIKVLNSVDGQALYGVKALNGTIIITSKYTKKELKKL